MVLTAVLVTEKEEARLLLSDLASACLCDLRALARARSASAMFPNPVILKLRANFKVAVDP